MNARNGRSGIISERLLIVLSAYPSIEYHEAVEYSKLVSHQADPPATRE